MIKVIILLVMTFVTIALCYPEDEIPDVQARSFPVEGYRSMGQENLEGAESANPQWGGRRWGGGGWSRGGYGGGSWGWGNRGWGGGGGWRGGWGGWRG